MKFATTALISACLTAGAALAQDAGLNEGHLAAIDKNNDGFLSKDEFNAFKDYAFQAMDEDKNGAISRAESEAHIQDEMFDRTDVDANGLISPGEFNAQMEQEFLDADRDGNAVLD